MKDFIPSLQALASRTDLFRKTEAYNGSIFYIYREMPLTRSQSKKSFSGTTLLVLGAIIVLGAFARAHDLAWHFTHNDDIGAAKSILYAKIKGAPGFLAVSNMWTYAPLQFVFTDLLLNLDLSYREVLFRARIPSFAAGILGLYFLMWFYAKRGKHESGALIFAAALLAFSWENVIMAKQIYTYAIGIPAALLIFVLWQGFLNKEDFSVRRMALAGALLALLCHAQYQVFFFLPAFYVTLFVLAVRRSGLHIRTFFSFAVSTAVLVLFVTPLYIFFLAKHAGNGAANYGRGPNLEFLFDFPESSGLVEKTAYAVKFFAGNLYLIFRNNTGFLPYEHPFFAPAGVILFILFCAGIWRCAVSSERSEKMLAAFAGVTALTWIALVCMQKISFGPSRHSVILLVLMAVFTAEGLDYAAARVFKDSRQRRFAAVISAGCLAVLFFISFPSMVEARRDPFREEEITAMIERYDVDAVIMSGMTHQLSLMKGVMAHVGYQDTGFIQEELFASGKRPYRTVAWASHKLDFTPENLENIRARIVRTSFRRGDKRKAFWADFDQLEVIDAVKKESNVEIEYGRYVPDGANSIYFYILRNRAEG